MLAKCSRAVHSAVFLSCLAMNHLICPLCAHALIENLQGVACQNCHQFDRAKEGYFNLLPVQYKNSREPGDAKEQLNARRQFLQAGYFSSLVQHLLSVVDPAAGTLLDIGCGEGYFTRALAAHCDGAELYGIDIAKAGIRLAAKGAVKNITYAVASSYQLPIASDSMDWILRIYAPSKDEELTRVLKTTGRLLIVTPGENHLLGIRKRIYREIKPYQQPVAPQGFFDVSQASVRFPLRVPAGNLTRALMQMTPFAWKLNAEALASFEQEGVMDQADFCINIYKKNNAPQ